MTAHGIKASQRELVSPGNCCKAGFNLPSRILSALEPRSKKLGPRWQCKAPSNSGSWTQTRCNFWMPTFRAGLWKTGDEAASLCDTFGQSASHQGITQLRLRLHCKVRMPVAQRGGEWSCYREWSCSTVGHSSSLWESTREMQKQPEAEAGAGREGVRAAGTQTPCCGGRDTHGATGDPTLAVGTQQENELFAKWKKRKERLENYHTKILNSGSGNSITFIGCLTRKATHTLEAS